MSAPHYPPLRIESPSPSRALPVHLHGFSCISAPKPRRDRIWELSPNLHCSIIGTCLPASALRQLFAKLNQRDAKTASDHDLHSRAVSAAGKHDVAGKLLNRMLEKRHEVHVKRFAKAKDTSEVRALWREAFERGDIPGAYWAALTHPATDQLLVSEVFGEVHMLSHLVGMSSRIDIVRLRELERQLSEREEAMARQEERIARMARQREDLTREVGTLRQELKQRPGPVATLDGDSSLTSALKKRLAVEQAHSAELGSRLAEQKQALSERGEAIKDLETHVAALQEELSALEATLADLTDAPDKTAEAPANLTGIRLLYVGGRPRQIDQLRSIAARFGGTLLSHDGGIEDNTALLPGLVSQANAVLFPVDCVSHSAAGQVKRLCRETGKPFVPLRSASLSSFLVAIPRLSENHAGSR